MKKVSKKQTPYNTIFLSKIIGLVLLTLFLVFIWDIRRRQMGKQKLLLAVTSETQVSV
ncbi:hypothetical protein M2353_002054 [Bacillus aerius]|nr:hypothetical protein [Bacillus aerius]